MLELSLTNHNFYIIVMLSVFMSSGTDGPKKSLPLNHEGAKLSKIPSLDHQGGEKMLSREI